jgi:predicted GTPase
VSNRYVRESIDKRILKLLCYNHSTPAILVLNKLDTIPRSRRVYDLVAVNPNEAFILSKL